MSCFWVTCCDPESCAGASRGQTWTPRPAPWCLFAVASAACLQNATSLVQGQQRAHLNNYMSWFTRQSGGHVNQPDPRDMDRKSKDSVSLVASWGAVPLWMPGPDFLVHKGKSACWSPQLSFPGPRLSEPSTALPVGSAGASSSLHFHPHECEFSLQRVPAPALLGVPVADGPRRRDELALLTLPKSS